MDEREKEALIKVLNRLAGVYQVLDCGVLHTNGTTMMLYIKEFKAIQNGVLDSIARIKDAINYGQ